MSWLAIALLGHFFNALAAIADKFFLSKVFKSSYTFAFVIGAFSLFAVVLIPFGVQIPTGGEFFQNIATGVAFLVSLVLFYAALQRAEVSRIGPYIGAMIPIFTLLLAAAFLDEVLTMRELGAFVILVVGGVTIMLQRQHIHGAPFSMLAFVLATAAALGFATSFILSKYVYSSQPFISSFFWQRLGSVIVLPFLFANRNVRQEVLDLKSRIFGRLGGQIIVAKGAGGLGFILVQYAINLGSVSLVNALTGVQYGFLVLIALLTSIWYPKILKEHFRGAAIWQKAIGIVLIALGLYLLA